MGAHVTGDRAGKSVSSGKLAGSLPQTEWWAAVAEVPLRRGLRAGSALRPAPQDGAPAHPRLRTQIRAHVLTL